MNNGRQRNPFWLYSRRIGRITALIFVILSAPLSYAQPNHHPRPKQISTVAALCGSLLERVTSDPSQFSLSYLGWQYRGEDKGISRKFGLRKYVKYFDLSERLQFQITFVDGAAVRADGAQLQGCYDYTVDGQGNIFAVKHESGQHHSSLIAGAPAACAGSMCFNADQKIRSLDRVSGHYKPSRRQLRAFIDWLARLGADLSTAKIDLKRTHDNDF